MNGIFISESIITKDNKIGIVDWLFVAGSILAVMTELRLPGLPIGPGELLLFVWIFIKLLFFKPKCNSERVYKHVFFEKYFWILILFSFGIGTLINKLFFQYNNSLHDLFSLIYTFLLVYTLSSRETYKKIIRLINVMSVCGSVWFLSLYIIARSGIMFSIKLMYGGVRFCGGADNPNTLATFMICIPFLCLVNIDKAISKRKLSIVFFWGVLFVISTIVSLATRSDATKLSYILSPLIYIVFKIPKLIRFNLFVWVYAIVTAIFTWFVINVGVNAELIKRLFASFDHDSSRKVLWSGAFSKTVNNLGLGYGPGGFLDLAGRNNRWEAHNTVLDLLMQGGILMALVIVFAYIYGLLKLRSKPLYATGFAVFVLGSLAGYKIRKPWFWFFFIYFFSLIYYCREYKNENLYNFGVHSTISGNRINKVDKNRQISCTDGQ